MYNSHRPPIGVPAPPPNTRLNELLEQVRAEFEGQATRAVDYEQQRKFASVSFMLRPGTKMFVAIAQASAANPAQQYIFTAPLVPAIASVL